MILLTAEEILDAYIGSPKFEVEDGADIARAQLKKVAEKIETLTATGWRLRAIVKALKAESKN